MNGHIWIFVLQEVLQKFQIYWGHGVALDLGYQLRRLEAFPDTTGFSCNSVYSWLIHKDDNNCLELFAMYYIENYKNKPLILFIFRIIKYISISVTKLYTAFNVV